MNLIKSPSRLACVLALCAAGTAAAQTNLPSIEILADKVMSHLPPTFYGLMTEEINYSYEGGLYGELIRNRAFKANAIQSPIKPEDYDPAKYYPVSFNVTNGVKFWSTLGNAGIFLDTNVTLNSALNVSLRAELGKASAANPAGIVNQGYWGIPLRPATSYQASFYAKASHFKGPLTVALQSADGKQTIAQTQVAGVTGEWQKYSVTLTTPADLTASKSNRFVILADVPGVDPSAIEIQMDKNVLSIKGERVSEATKENEKVTRSERTYGQFYRSFALPEGADAEGITAAGKHGVLEIAIPKKPEIAPRRIAVAQ